MLEEIEIREIFSNLRIYISFLLKVRLKFWGNKYEKKAPTSRGLILLYYTHLTTPYQLFSSYGRFSSNLIYQSYK